MPLDLQSFMQAMAAQDGPAKPTHFAVRITSPKSVNLTSTEARTLSLFCDSTSLPGMQIGLDDQVLNYGYGVPQRMPWGVVFTDLTMTFYCDNNGLITQIFHDWLDSIVRYNDTDPFHNESNRGFFVSYREDYATTIDIQLFDPQNQTIVTYTLYDCFPSAMYDQEVAWSASNDILKLPVRFSFQRWTTKYSKIDSDYTDSINQIQSMANSLLTGQLPPNLISNDVNNLFQGSLYSSSLSQPVRSFIDNYKSALPLLGGRDFFI